MKIVSELIESHIDFSQNFCWALVIENPALFYKYAKTLIEQCNGGEGAFALSEGGKSLDFQKYCFAFYNFFDLSLDSKSNEIILNKSMLNFLRKGDYYQEFGKINQELFNFCNKIKREFDLPVEFSGELNQENFLKVINFKLHSENTLLDQIISIVEMLIKIKQTKVFIFVDIFRILSEKDVSQLIKQLQYFDVKILFVESSLKYNIKHISRLIIDKDLCEIA